ncbi:MAG TPA: QueG-associated DUF1730 domain-containing protein, partial [Chloroflexota bacterium]|nr:QueG-associated DUF1730 domain-containing protein [Chloroflexota bacterium]
MALAEDVKGMALEVGFDLVGIASAEPLRDAEVATLGWLREGMAAGMGWITEERVRLSCDPVRLLPGARSIIALARAYPSQLDLDPAHGLTGSVIQREAKDLSSHEEILRSAQDDTRQRPRGRIARYALGDDYHDVLLSRVRQLLDAVSSSLGTRPAGRFFVDSS